jgi:very-short-patch-repair endonuclease
MSAAGLPLRGGGAARRDGGVGRFMQENRFPRKEGSVEAARAQRKGMSRAAKHLWYDFLRRYPLRFRRQEIIGDYTVDFFCYKARMAVEVIGPLSPPAPMQTEKARFLRSLGIEILCFPAERIVNDFPGVCTAIDLAVRLLVPAGAFPPHPSVAQGDSSPQGEP